jgi:hypothetical protein
MLNYLAHTWTLRPRIALPSTDHGTTQTEQAQTLTKSQNPIEPLATSLFLPASIAPSRLQQTSRQHAYTSPSLRPPTSNIHSTSYNTASLPKMPLRPEAPAWYPARNDSPMQPFAQIFHPQGSYNYHPIPGIHYAAGFYPILPSFDYTYFPISPPPYRSSSEEGLQEGSREEGREDPETNTHAVPIVTPPKRPRGKKGGKKKSGKAKGTGQVKQTAHGDEKCTEVTRAKDSQQM